MGNPLFGGRFLIFVGFSPMFWDGFPPVLAGPNPAAQGLGPWTLKASSTLGWDRHLAGLGWSAVAIVGRPAASALRKDSLPAPSGGGGGNWGRGEGGRVLGPGRW